MKKGFILFFKLFNQCNFNETLCKNINNMNQTSDSGKSGLVLKMNLFAKDIKKYEYN